MNLTKKKCVPCEAGTLPMSSEEVAKYGEQIKDWEVLENKKLRKEFLAASGATRGGQAGGKSPFEKVMVFANAIARLAESEGHHPDMEIHYDRLVVELSTHAVKGLSENDFILAAKIDALDPTSTKIVYDDFAKVEIKMGKILTAEPIEGADKLLKLTIDLGEGEPRTICSGIAQYYSPDLLVGKTVPVIANLAPRKLRGIESNGMVLMAIDEASGAHRPILLLPEENLPPGSPAQ